MRVNNGGLIGVRNIFEEITAAAEDNRHCSLLEASLEHCMDELIMKPDFTVSSLKSLVAMESGIAVTGMNPSAESATGGFRPRGWFSMGMTYFAVAVMASESGGVTSGEHTSLLLTVVEQHLLSPSSGAYNRLRGHSRALQRFGQLLRGYTFLPDAREADSKVGKLYYLQGAAMTFSPSVGYLTVAHPLLVREATRSGSPTTALVVMRQPVVKVSSAETGAGLACCCSYYYEGGLLLASMQCWESCATWLRSTLSLMKATPQAGSSELMVVAEPDNISTEQYVSNTIVSAAKAYILVSVIVYGNWGDPADHTKIQSMIHQYRTTDLVGYTRLLTAAQRRDLVQWETIRKAFSQLWERDGTASLVDTATTRLQRHIIMGIAKVSSRVHLSTITSALNPRTPNKVARDDGAPCSDDSVNEKSTGEVDVLKLLLAMREDGELVVSIEQVPHSEGSEENVELSRAEEAVDTSSMQQQQCMAVRLGIPPRRLLSELGEGCEKHGDLCLREGGAQRATESEIRRVLHSEIERCKRVYAALMDVSSSLEDKGLHECEEE